MNDPHVVSLEYRLETGKGTSFSDPPVLRKECDDFEIELGDAVLTVFLKGHFPTVDTARVDVDRFLRAWELDADLRLGIGSIRFEYVDAEVIDRNPPKPAESRVEAAGVSEAIAIGGRFSARTIYCEYPEPPRLLEYDHVVENMWRRFKAHKEGKEPLQGMAYYCLTEAEKLAGGNRKKSAQLLNVDPLVLSKMGLFSSAYGDPQTARKARAAETPLSKIEMRWLVSSIVVLIRRIGERKHASSLPRITMGDLPKL